MNQYFSGAKRYKRLGGVFFLITLIYIPLLNAQDFLTAKDFARAAKEEEVTFLTEEDFRNANKFRDILSKKTSGSRNILTMQKYFRGDIRGKAAWRRGNNRSSFRFGTLLFNNNNVRHNGVTKKIKKWPNARIPYVLSTEYTEKERAMLARAFQEYHTRTCIRFTPRSTGDRDFLFIGKIDGCFSDVGRAGGRQELSLDNGCLHLDTILHELMHSVGFYHEHERWDRDRYIDILWSNIDRDAYDQFGRVDLVESSYYGQSYDYYSIMHYDSMAFSKNGMKTLIAKVPEMTKIIGAAMDFSPTDLLKIHNMYECAGLITNNDILPGNFGGIISSLPSPIKKVEGEILSSFSSSGFGDTPAVVQRPSYNLLLPSSRPAPLPLLSNAVRRQIWFKNGDDTLPKWSNVSNWRNFFYCRDNVPLPKQQPIVTNWPAMAMPSPNECADRATMCWRWLDRCRSPFFDNVMRQFCAKSCDLCPIVTTPPFSPMDEEMEDDLPRRRRIAIDSAIGLYHH